MRMRTSSLETVPKGTNHSTSDLWTTGRERTQESGDIKEVVDAVVCKIGKRVARGERLQECRDIKEVEHAITSKVCWTWWCRVNTRPESAGE